MTQTSIWEFFSKLTRGCEHAWELQQISMSETVRVRVAMSERMTCSHMTSSTDVVRAQEKRLIHHKKQRH